MFHFTHNRVMAWLPFQKWSFKGFDKNNGFILLSKNQTELSEIILWDTIWTICKSLGHIHRFPVFAQ